MIYRPTRLKTKTKEAGQDNLQTLGHLPSHVLVEGDGCRRVLEENVGHPDLEFPELGHLPNDLAGYEVTPSRRSGDGHRSLSPRLLPCLNLQGTQTRAL